MIIKQLSGELRRKKKTNFYIIFFAKTKNNS